MNSLNFFKVNKLIFIALFLGMTIFAGVAFVLNTGKTMMVFDMTNAFTVIVPIFLIGGIYASKFVFNRLIGQIEQAKTLQQKIGVYTTTSIIRFAIIEGAVLLSIVAFLISANLYFLIFTAAGIIYFLSLMPNEEKISKQAHLTYEERNELGLK